MSNLWALIGAATFLARFMALSKSAQTLFMPVSYTHLTLPTIA